MLNKYVRIKVFEYLTYAILMIGLAVAGFVIVKKTEYSGLYIGFQIYMYTFFVMVPIVYMIFGAIKEASILEYSMHRYATVCTVFIMIVGTLILYAFYNLETVEKFNAHFIWYLIISVLGFAMSFVACYILSKKNKGNENGPRIVKNR